MATDTRVYLPSSVISLDGFLSRAGKSDSIKDTVDYESLTIIDVVERAFEVAGENGKEACIVPSSFIWRRVG